MWKKELYIPATFLDLQLKQWATAIKLQQKRVLCQPTFDHMQEQLAKKLQVALGVTH